MANRTGWTRYNFIYATLFIYLDLVFLFHCIRKRSEYSIRTETGKSSKVNILRRTQAREKGVMVSKDVPHFRFDVPHYKCMYYHLNLEIANKKKKFVDPTKKIVDPHYKVNRIFTHYVFLVAMGSAFPHFVIDFLVHGFLFRFSPRLTAAHFIFRRPLLLLAATRGEALEATRIILFLRRFIPFRQRLCPPDETAIIDDQTPNSLFWALLGRAKEEAARKQNPIFHSADALGGYLIAGTLATISFNFLAPFLA